MKQHLYFLFTQALAQLQIKGVLPADLATDALRIERSRDSQHGDFACNAAMVLAKSVKMRPRDLATQLVELLPGDDPAIAKIEIAGPGFINIFLTASAHQAIIDEILTRQGDYGKIEPAQQQSVLIEFVSANPTGPLHVGHGRGAAYGAALANLLRVAGYQVVCEYYVNDAGRQMDILATSVWLRYLDLCGETVKFPTKGYQGDYIWDIAADLHREQGEVFRHDAQALMAGIPADKLEAESSTQAEENLAATTSTGNAEQHIDALIARCKQWLGADAYQQIFQRSITVILADIRRDLEQFGVVYEQWFSEASLMSNQTVQKAIEQLKNQGHLYENAGALWFRSTAFGDEKDRVVIRENGQFTYFASDIAYHLNKLERGFDHLINIWGADHHGYVARVKAAIAALGGKNERLRVLLVQFVSLYRGKERIPMSTRSGEYVTLRELREEVGRDAARFFYVERKCEQHLDFDLELAASKKMDNPVYYVQYAHARIASVFKEAQEKNIHWHHAPSVLQRLDKVHEKALLVNLSRYPEVIENAAKNYEVHLVTYYLRELARDFHSFYGEHKILTTNEELCQARLSLCAAVQQVLRNGFNIIGVSAPEVM